MCKQEDPTERLLCRTCGRPALYVANGLLYMTGRHDGHCLGEFGDVARLQRHRYWQDKHQGEQPNNLALREVGA